MKIEKKTWPDYFQKILDGNKNFEIRLADWECEEGDTLVLKEWDPELKRYTGRVVEKEVTYIAKTKEMKFFSEDDVEKYGYQVIGIR